MVDGKEGEGKGWRSEGRGGESITTQCCVNENIQNLTARVHSASSDIRHQMCRIFKNMLSENYKVLPTT